MAALMFIVGKSTDFTKPTILLCYIATVRLAILMWYRVYIVCIYD